MPEIQRIERPEDIDDALSCSRAIVFKHSTRCPISADARRHVETFAETCDDSISLFMVDVIEDRDLSNEIERRTGVAHHSPQVIFIRDKKIAGTVTHWNITSDTLTKGIFED